MTGGIGTFHHVGLACRSIEAEIAGLAALGYVAEGEAISDPIQKVRVQFFAGAGPRVELVEPAAADSPVQGVLKRGTKLYHFAYEVRDLDIAMAQLSRQGYRPLTRPAPAVAFAMRQIVFMMSASLNLIELIEQEP